MRISKRTWNFGFVLILGLLISMLLFDALIVVAQEDGSEATAAAPPSEQLDDASNFIEVDSATSLLLNNLVNAIAVSVYLPSAAGFVLILTNVSKWIIPSQVPSRFIQLFWMLALWTVFVVAQNLGYGSEFDLALKKLTEIGYILLGGSVTQLAASSIYDKAAEKNLLITGYKRPD